MRRVYLDNAATSWPKSSAACEAAMAFVRDCGATAGRGVYTSGQVADRWLSNARRNLARLIGANNPQGLAICCSGTHALNAALHGVLHPGDRVVTTAIEHNSVLRPLNRLVEQLGIELVIAPCDAWGIVDIEQAAALVDSRTALLVVGHASNVTGAVQDLKRWSQLASQASARLLVDASQTLGYLPISVERDGIDMLAAAGHKGLRAMPGTGFLYASPDLHVAFQPLMSGGTGLQSETLDAGVTWPACVEVGNLNMAGVVSMAVAAEEAQNQLSRSPEPTSQPWLPPFQRLLEGLRGQVGLSIAGHPTGAGAPVHVPLVSVLVDDWDVHDFAAVLDTHFGIEARAGWHCAALVHQSLSPGVGDRSGGTSQLGYSGTLRLSTGHSTSIEEIEYTLDAFRQILG
jgi:cysteine desulfurase / selenocysteine lyase